jgi:hypothetical protein
LATNIIAAIRSNTQVHGNKKFTAIEVAHLMNRSGYGRVAYQMIAWKTGSSRRTAIRHMTALVELGIFSKTIYCLANGYAINLYKCLLPLPAFYHASPATTHGDRLSPILPAPKTGEGKELSLREEIRRQRWGLDTLSLSAEARQACREELARLEALIERRPA